MATRSEAHRFMRGAAWAALDFWGQQLAGLVALLVIGRLVGPPALGLMATAQVAVALMMTLLLDSLADALVQRRRLTRFHRDTAFWLLLALGLAAGLALASVAPLLALAFGEPELTSLLWLLAPGLPLVGVSASLQAGLQREMRFYALALRTIVAQGSGLLLGIVLALRGVGVEALAAQFLLARAVDAALLLALAPRPGLALAWPALRHIIGYGRHRLANQLVGFLVMQVDRVSVALLLGTAALGVYAVAERIATALVNGLSGVALRVAFPLLSACQEDDAAFDRSLRDLLLLVLLVAAPAFTGLALVAAPLIDLLMDPRWAAAASPLALLSLAGIPHAVNYLLTAAANARGRPELIVGASLRVAVLRVGASLAAAPFGLLPVAVANLVVTLLSTLLVLRALHPVVPTAPQALRQAIILPAGAILGMAAVLLGLRAVLPPLPAAVLLAIEVTAGVFAYALAMLVLAPAPLRGRIILRFSRRSAGRPAASAG